MAKFDGISFYGHENRDEVYPLPMPDMTNDEIKDYFRILKEEEE